MYVKPAPDRVVPDPMMRDFLPAEGRDVVPSSYWTRRLMDGDVVEASDPAAAPAKAGKSAAKTGNEETSP